MIACVCPTDTSVRDTLSTLEYDSRARNIPNKPIINQNLVATKKQKMQRRIEELEADVQILKTNSSLEASNLRSKLEECEKACKHISHRLILRLKQVLQGFGASWKNVKKAYKHLTQGFQDAKSESFK
ncbi:hypothetical protein U1Q18_041002 [Sarracenia purpurea var. burkii]